MTRSQEAESRTSPSHPRRARRSRARWIGFRRLPGPMEHRGLVSRKSPTRAGVARLGRRPAGRRGRLPGTVRLQQAEPEGRRMQMGKIRCPRRVVHRAIARPRHLSVTGGAEAPRLPVRLPRYRHSSGMSGTGGVEALRPPPCRRRNRVEPPPIASLPARHRRELPPRGRHGRDRQSKLTERRRLPVRRPRGHLRQHIPNPSRLTERRRPPAHRPLCRETPAVPRRHHERKTPLPAPVRTTRTTPTWRQST